ncbi:MAG: hypothetical protein EBZ77_06260, partial [Chitinophagia bacterium]|nr:hypothetical protein [Chitinophagia bacterium]
SVNQVKYILVKDRINPFWRYTCDSLTKLGDVTVLRNRYALPFGFTYNKYIKLSDYIRLGDEQRSILALKACVVNDKDAQRLSGLEAYPISDTTQPFSPEMYAADAAACAREVMHLQLFSDNHIKGTIDVSGPKMVYLSIPNDAGWTAKVDGKECVKEVLTNGMTGLMLQKGHHDIELVYQLRYWGTGLQMSACGAVLFIVLFFLIRKDRKLAPLQQFKVD